MKPGKLLLISSLLITIFSANLKAEVLKPFAPPMNIQGEQLENNEDLNINNEDTIKNVQSSETIKDNNIPDEIPIKILKEKDEININKRHDEQLKVIESYNINDSIEIPEELNNQQATITEKEEVLEEIPAEEPEIEDEEEIIKEQQPGLEADLEEPRTLTDIQIQADNISHEMRIEEASELSALRILWTAAVENNTTIRLAIQKLSSPDEGSDGQSSMSKIFSPLAGAASVAAMAASSSTQAAGALLGGGLFGTLASDRDHSYNQAFIRVSDYNLIMLAKEVDELQKNLVFCYYEYKQALDRLVEAENAMNKSEGFYQKVQTSNNFAAITAADAFYRESKQNHLKAKQEFFNARSDLEQITGNDAIVYIETMGNEQNLTEDKHE